MKPSELKKELSEGKDIILVDVREAEELTGLATIPGAENMPMGKVFLQAYKGMLPKDKKIVTVCKSGGRCEIVARELRQKGFDIEHLEGGIEGWNTEHQQ